MNRRAKIIAILTCVTLCAAGAIFSHQEQAKDNRAKAKVVPVNNRAKQTKVWTWA